MLVEGVAVFEGSLLLHMLEASLLLHMLEGSLLPLLLLQPPVAVGQRRRRLNVKMNRQHEEERGP